MNYDIRYDIGDLVDVVSGESDTRFNPWTVREIIIKGDRGVHYQLSPKDGGLLTVFRSEHLREHVPIDPATGHRKIYVSDPDIVAMVKEMTPEERDRLALKFESFLGWTRGDRPGVRFEIVEDE